MKKAILLSSVLLVSIMVSAREMNPVNPDFDHRICLTNRSVNPAAGQTVLNKKEALEALVGMSSMSEEAQGRFSSLNNAYKNYYKKLQESVRSDGRELSSYLLDQQLDLSGDCDGVNSVLLDITRNLK